VTGSTGGTGATGPSLAGYERVTGSSGTTSSTANCGTGNLVLGGGYELTSAESGDVVTVNRATDDDTWEATVLTAGDTTITAFAICATP
jgi:hypothetical protein